MQLQDPALSRSLQTVFAPHGEGSQGFTYVGCGGISTNIGN